MTQVFKRNKRLLVAAIATLLFLGGYTLFVDSSYFNPGKATYPTISEEQAAEIVADRIYAERGFGVSPDEMVTELYVNADTERFLAEHRLTDEYTRADGTPPISMWKVSYYDWDTDLESVYFVDLYHGDIIGFLDASYYDEQFQNEASTDESAAYAWLKKQGWAEYFTHTTTETNSDGIVIHHFVSKSPVAGDTPLLLKVYTHDGWFIGFYSKLDVPDSYVADPFKIGLSHSISIAGSFGYMGLIFIVGLIYWAMRATDKSLTVTVPLLTGIAVFILAILMMTNIVGLLEGLMSGLLVFMAMLAVYSKRDQLANRSKKRLHYLREKVFQGYMSGIIMFLPSFFFYTIAENVFDAWGSAEDSFMLLKDAQWIVLTPLLIGLYAAITEEIMYRKFGEFVFKRLWKNQIFIALATSLIWSVGHLAYTVHPWYLRVVELTLFVGPFMYWIYKQYGVSVSIIAHYLFNCFLVCLTLMSFDADRYVYTLLFLLVPLIIYVIPAKRHKPNSQPLPAAEK